MQIRLRQSEVMFILLGSNDAGSPGGFDFNASGCANCDGSLLTSLSQRPKPDRFEGRRQHQQQYHP